MGGSISDEIRSLAGAGLSVADIARRLGIRYQHAYKVCRDAGFLTKRTTSGTAPKPAALVSKPALTVETLLGGGFRRGGCWILEGDQLLCATGLPDRSGIYAFGIGSEIVYVGLASRSLARRLYFYAKPGVGQRTNIRLNAIVREQLVLGQLVEIFCAEPPDFDWNGFPISGVEGLEAGLIRRFRLPWNVKGTQP